MNKEQLITYLSRMDAALSGKAILCVYGSAVFILLDEVDRTSLDIDVAAPYSTVDFADFKQAAEKAGLQINPPEEYSLEHIEWISQLRLCLPAPQPQTEMILWQGKKLTLKTVSISELIASKLIRYDAIDQTDIQFVCTETKVAVTDIEAAVESLPSPFNSDPIVRQNLEHLKVDLQQWLDTRA